MHLAAFLPLALLPLALAESYQVTVGKNADGVSGQFYTPDKLSPKKGDTVVFSFTGSEHSVAQSTFDKPCEYLDGGIYSGFPGAGKTFTITVNDTKPIWLFCSRPGHCQAGQALVLNEPQDKTLDAYKAAATEAEGDGDDDEDLPVTGGVVAEADTAASTSATGPAKSTGGSTNTSSRLSSSISASASSSASAGASASASASSASGSAASATSAAPAATSTGAAGRLTAGAGLGAVGLLGFLVGGMV